MRPKPSARVSPLVAETPAFDPRAPTALYTDGSHIKGTPRRGWGAALVHRGRVYVLSGVADRATDPAAASNPTMELRAAAAALERVRQVRVPVAELYVRADYIGVREYGAGRWRAASAKIGHFRAEALRLERAAAALRASGVALRFEHVRGHSGDPGNELADALARSGKTRDTFNDLRRDELAESMDMFAAASM